MSTETLIEQLRQEVAALRREVESLRGAIYPRPQPYMPFALPHTPYIPGLTAPTTCRGGTDFSKSYGPNAP